MKTSLARIALVMILAFVGFSALAAATPAATPTSLAMLAQDPEPVPVPVEIDWSKVDGILVIIGGGLATLITQLLKKWLKFEGVLAVVFTGVICVVCTGIYFLFISPMHPFNGLAFGLYAFIVFGEATMLFHFRPKPTA